MKNKMLNRCDGFTLIELLVVVLIIGILASVALPQYNLAVAKSRLAAILPALSTLQKAEEEYYLKEGAYTYDMDVLTINMDTCKQIYIDVVQCGSYFMIDPLHNTDPTLRAYYCPEKIRANGNTVGASAWSACRDNSDFIYTVWLEHSDTPNARTCVGNTSFGQKVCKTLNF